MEQLVLLLAICILIICVSAYASRPIFFTPQVTFSCGFVFAILYAALSYTFIPLDMHVETFIFLLTGIGIFFLVSLITAKIIDLVGVKKYNPGKKIDDYIIKTKLPSSKMMMTITIIHFFIVAFMYILIVKTTGSSSIIEAIDKVKQAGFTLHPYALPTPVYWIQRISNASGYIWSYLLLICLEYKMIMYNKKWYFINFIISIASTFAFGSRGGMLGLILAFFIQAYIIYEKKYNWNKRIPIKYILGIVILGIIGVVGFTILGYIMRENISDVAFEKFLFVYAAGPIANLDTFISKGQFGSDLRNNQTFAFFISWVAKILDEPEYIHGEDIPTLYYQGENMGNVVTTFYAFSYDYGLAGIVLLTGVMAIIAQVTFSKAVVIKRIGEDISSLNLHLIIYSFIFPHLLLSFFSNRFYQNVFSIDFCAYCIFWITLKYVLRHYRITW